MTTIQRTIHFSIVFQSFNLSFTILENGSVYQTGSINSVGITTTTVTIDTSNIYTVYVGSALDNSNILTLLNTNEYGDANIKIFSVNNNTLIYYNPITLVIDISNEALGFLDSRLVTVSGTALTNPINFLLNESTTPIYLQNILLDDPSIVSNPNSVNLTIQIGSDSQPLSIFTGYPRNQVYGPFTRNYNINSPTSFVGFFQIDRNVAVNTGLSPTIMSASLQVYASEDSNVPIATITLPFNLRFRPTLLENIPLVPLIYVVITLTFTDRTIVILPKIPLLNINNCISVRELRQGQFIPTIIPCNQGPMILRPSIIEKQITIIGKNT